MKELTFLKEAESVFSSDFWYDLFDGGYFKPENFLEKNSAKHVRSAMDVLLKYREELEERELIEIL